MQEILHAKMLNVAKKSRIYNMFVVNKGKNKGKIATVVYSSVILIIGFSDLLHPG